MPLMTPQDWVAAQNTRIQQNVDYAINIVNNALNEQSVMPIVVALSPLRDDELAILTQKIQESGWNINITQSDRYETVINLTIP